MREILYVVLDVFTDKPLAGNPLAVFPNRSGLLKTEMQRIARELNLSETVFVEEARDDSALRRLRIFTPTRELRVAGHPVIGTWIYLLSSGIIDIESEKQAGRITAEAVTAVIERLEFKQDLNAGILPVSVQRRGGSVQSASMEMPRPQFGDVIEDLQPFATGLNLQPEDITGSGLPPQFVDIGDSVKIILPVASMAALTNVKIDLNVFESHFCMENCEGVYAFSRESENKWAFAHARGFFHCVGILEDPATGHGAACLGAYLAHHKVIDASPTKTIEIEQGIELGRPSRIGVSVTAENDEIIKIEIFGTAVQVGEGKFLLPD